MTIGPNAHCDFPANYGPASIIAMMGGVAAEVIVFNNYDHTGCRYDVASVRHWLARCRADADTLWAHTIRLLRPQASLLCRVAIKLRRQQVLDGGEIDRIVFRDGRVSAWQVAVTRLPGRRGFAASGSRW